MESHHVTMTLALLAITALTTCICSPVSTASDPRCNLPAKQSGCQRYSQVWSYDKLDKRCIAFWYGGCNGNDNRFETEEECKNTCVQSRTGISYSWKLCRDLPLELVFIIDAGVDVDVALTSPGSNLVRNVMPFIVGLNGKFTIAPNATRVGLVIYNEMARMAFHFDGNSKGIIDRTNTASAIKMATEQVFIMSRVGVRKVAIVIPGGESNDRARLGEAVNAAKRGGIEMHAVGIHDETDGNSLKELSLIASDPTHVHVKSSEGSAEIELTKRLCATTAVSTPDPRCNLPAVQTEYCGTWTQGWSYDRRNKRCIRFWYGGCNGNNNRFETEEECKNTCG